MADLVVDTALLQRAARELTEVAHLAATLDDRGGRVAVMIPAVGRHCAAQAVATFADAWVYGIGWIGTQAQDLAGRLLQTAAAFAAVEARLAVGIGPIPPIHLPAAATACPTAPTRPNWSHLAPTIAPPVQLGAATHVTQLVPGDPEVVRTGARTIATFADELGQARGGLYRIGLGCWEGEAARAARAQMTALFERLVRAEQAFATAADAITRYAAAHHDARELATDAMRLWEAAEHASAVARGAVVAGTGGPVLLPSGVDPDTEMARAVALLRTAQETLDDAERHLTAALDDACRGAPSDPGAWAQFTLGLEEGLTGIVGGGAEMATLAARLLPHRLTYDPHGWLDDHAVFWTGVGHAITHPKETGKELIDWDTWTTSPWRAAGKFTPEVLAALYTLGTAAAAGRFNTAGRLRQVADGVAEAKRNESLYPRTNRDVVNRRLSELGLARNSPAGRAAAQQLNPPFGVPDHWVPITLQPGQRIAIIGKFAIPVDGHLPSSARELFESVQWNPSRQYGPDGEVLQPTHLAEVPIFEVQSPLDSAAAKALANPQFGPGGGTQFSLPDVRADVYSERLIRVEGPEGTHRFDPDTLESRIEDPEFRAVDPKLPERALDPDREAVRTAGKAGVDEIRDYPVSVAIASAADHLEQQDQAQPERNR